MANSVRPGPSFNPFSWGSLFFTSWLTLITIPNMGTNQIVIAWIFFGLSCLLWLSTFIPPLDKPIASPIAQRIIIPLVFVASVFVWLMGSLTTLPQVPQSLQIIVLVGTILWSVAYMATIIWSSKVLGGPVGIVIPVLMIVLGVTYFFREHNPFQPWLVIALGVALLIITLFRNKIGRKFPLI